jgi:hypothetical protein
LNAGANDVLQPLPVSNLANIITVSRINGILSDIYRLRSKTWKFPRNFFKDQATVIFFTVLVTAVSAIFITISLFRHKQGGAFSALDDNFYAYMSSMILTLFSAFLLYLPSLRVGISYLRYPFMFNSSLFLSAVGAILSPALYMVSWQAALLCAYLSGLLQMIATLQLAECVDEGVKAGEIGVP